MSINPNKRFNIGSEIAVGSPANLTVFDLNKEYTVNPSDFLSMGKSTPFEGMSVYGVCKMTVCKGKIVWQEEA